MEFSFEYWSVEIRLKGAAVAVLDSASAALEAAVATTNSRRLIRCKEALGWLIEYLSDGMYELQTDI
jgi:hypothetical protein